LAVIPILALLLSGCEFGRNFVNKPWGKGTYIPAAVCAALGAGAGVGIQELRVGESCISINGELQCAEDDAEHWIGAVAGAAIGAGVCALAGHYFLDPEEPEPPPAPEPLPEPSSRRIVLRGLSFFDFDKSEIAPDSLPVLDAAADVLLENPAVRISIQGHTDSVGDDEYNEALSLRRAEAVYRHLVNRGIQPERLEAVGYGESRPVADNETESGRAQNRRTELQMIAE
jgi:outer membrane protein OmpA-like peptidoglycan-associated protein